MTRLRFAFLFMVFYEAPVLDQTLPRALTIAGFDPTGGAGILADSRVFERFGYRTSAILACLVPQSVDRVFSVEPVSVPAFRRQFEALADEAAPDTIKIGAIGSADLLAPIHEYLLRTSHQPSVADPVLRASDGTELFPPEARKEYLDRLGRHVALLTPNAGEAFALSDLPDTESPVRAAEILLSSGVPAVLIKSAKQNAEIVADLFWPKNLSSPIWFEHSRRQEAMPHGSGCHLSSAIASYLGRGENLESAVRKGLTWFQRALVESPIRSSVRSIFRRLPAPVEEF
ncbi:MAG TPA: hydroxymethylpyrimidine/phosphomethylpyrimidine kinase [Bdellovibrionota bacterium]|nr:hydroxymethylpyrimidine/phosphomethylpyrimidine kinase [Bdellovibrionota bacterium]